MAKNAVVSEELANKFKTEKETPYTRWVKDEGLDILPSIYVQNLRTVELKPWARRGGNAHSAARDRTEKCCHARLFLAAGNVTRAITYSTAAVSRTRLNPASRAIRLASGVATTEKAPFSAQAQGSNPPDPVWDRPSGKNRPRASDNPAARSSG